MDDDQLMEILREQETFIKGLSARIVALAEEQQKEAKVHHDATMAIAEAVRTLGTSVIWVLDRLVIQRPDDADIRVQISKLNEEFEAMQEMFADKILRPRPIAGKPPGLSLVKSAQDEDNEEQPI